MNAGALAHVRLIALTDRTIANAALTLARLDRALSRARPGSVLVQLRDRELSAAERLAFGAELRALTRAHGQLFQVNDRLDLAVLLAADGVHLGESSVTAEDARRLLGAESFVTRACHDAERAGELNADAVLLSPVFEPRKGAAALGLAAVTRACERLREAGRNTRVFALGGVRAENAVDCLAAGAQGVAAIGAVVGVDEPDAILLALGIARS